MAAKQKATATYVHDVDKKHSIRFKEIEARNAEAVQLEGGLLGSIYVRRPFADRLRKFRLTLEELDD